MKRKQGRVTERSRTVREEKKGKEENSFHGKVCAYLTCLLMGDPFETISYSIVGVDVAVHLGS